MRTITLEEHFARPAFLAGPSKRLAEGARLPGRLPFMLQRLDMMTVSLTQLKRPISAYLRQNIHYTFHGFNFTPTFLDLFLQVGVGRTMFSADYPYSSMTQAHSFLDQLPISAADRDRIAHGYAERVFGG